MTDRRTQAMTGAVYAPAPAGQWQGPYGAPYAPPSGGHQYPSSSYLSHHPSSSAGTLRPGQASPSSYQTVMGQTAGYQSPDRQTSPYNPVEHDRPSSHAAAQGPLPSQPSPYSTLDHHHTRLPQQASPTLGLQQHQHQHQHQQHTLALHSPPHHHRQQPPQHPYAGHPRALHQHQSLSYAPPPQPQHVPQPGSPLLQQQQYSPQHYTYSMDAASQYPASPQRPFSCDMCALSFNRQHDLKRHRDTHTGEKPFLCNGGCGKTFTRKDALKRHQLVKRCGIDEGA